MARWIAGGVVGAVVLFGVIAFSIDYNSPDARIKCAIAQIAEEHGLEPRTDWSKDAKRLWELGIDVEYRGPPIDRKVAAQIVDSLRDACPSFKYVLFAYDEDMEEAKPNAGDPWVELHVLVSSEQYEGAIHEIGLIPNDRGIRIPGGEPIAQLTVMKSSGPGLWQKVKNLWPW